MAEDNDILMPANINILSRISKNAKVFMRLIASIPLALLPQDGK
jgi:hypothetical protein